MATTPPPEVQDRTLAELTERCIRSALPALQAAVDEGLTPEKYSYFVRIERDADGRRRKTSADAPLRYSSLLRSEERSWEKGILYSSLDGFDALFEYLHSDSAYWDYMSGGERLRRPEAELDVDDDWPERWFAIQVGSFVSDLVDRHIHVSGWKFDFGIYLTNYVLLERELKGQMPDGSPLRVDALIPLYGVTFDTDALDGEVRIETLQDDQLAASWPGQRMDDDDEGLLLSATHVCVLPGVPVTKDPVAGWLTPTAWSFDPVDRLLEVLATSTDHDFGVKHVLYRHDGWSDGWSANGLAGGAWPWTHDRRTSDLRRSGAPSEPALLDQAVVQRRVVQLVSGRHEPRLAARRLLGALCRDDDIDAVIDVCIGIEALVGDSSPQEITYKLALRSAAVLAQNGYPHTKTWFGVVKNLYARRSSIVHGKTKADDRNTIKALGGQYTAHSIGTFVLNRLLSTVLDKPELGVRASNDDLVLALISQPEPPDADIDLNRSARQKEG